MNLYYYNTDKKIFFIEQKEVSEGYGKKDQVINPGWVRLYFLCPYKAQGRGV